MVPHFPPPTLISRSPRPPPPPRALADAAASYNTAAASCGKDDCNKVASRLGAALVLGGAGQQGRVAEGVRKLDTAWGPNQSKILTLSQQIKPYTGLPVVLS